MPKLASPLQQATVNPFRDPAAPPLVKPPTGQRMTVASAAAAAAKSANPGKSRIVKPAVIGAIAISLIGLAFGLGRWLPGDGKPADSATARSGETLEPAKLDPALISSERDKP